MSHVCLIDVRVKNRGDLAAACKALGLEWLPHETRWAWFGRWLDDFHGDRAAHKHGVQPEEYGTADAGVIRVPGAQYDIGVYRRGGIYLLVYDSWEGGRGIEARLGAGLTKLRQAYSEAVSTRHLRMQGFAVRRQVTADGRILLTGTRAR